MSLARWVRILAGRTVAYRLGAPDFDTLQDVLDTHEAGNQHEGGRRAVQLDAKNGDARQPDPLGAEDVA
jgi:hypothetical protein